jgi:hypothetical protein
MVNVNVVGGYDGVTDPPGMTSQSTTSTLDIGAALESSGGGTLGVTSTPAGNGYLAWSMIPEDAIASNAHTTLNGILTRVVAATGGPSAHLDMVITTVGTPTNAVMGIYSGASFATGPLAWTADFHASITATGMLTVTWNGSSSPSSVNLVAGQTYWIYSEITGATTNLAGCAGNATALNANLTASATYANNSMNIASGPYTTLTSSSSLTPQTTLANCANKMWFGLRA